MTKEELMQLADAYGECLYLRAERHDARSTLSDAIDAALKQARMDALEEVLALPQIKGNLFAEKAIRALKETK